MDGVLEIRLLYLTADDQTPVGAASEVLPFHLMAAADGLTQDVVYEIEPGISGLTAVMAGGDAVEVKAQITADVLVLKPVCEQTVPRLHHISDDPRHFFEPLRIQRFLRHAQDRLLADRL